MKNLSFSVCLCYLQWFTFQLSLHSKMKNQHESKLHLVPVLQYDNVSSENSALSKSSIQKKQQSLYHKDVEAVDVDFTDMGFFKRLSQHQDLLYIL